MSDIESDEDLKVAIALSLQSDSSPRPKKGPVTIDLISSDEEILPKQDRRIAERDRKAQSTLDISRNSRAALSAALPVETTRPDVETQLDTKPTLSSTSLLGLNRRQMEEERLARVCEQPLQNNRVHNEKKRRASTSPPSSKDVQVKISRPNPSVSGIPLRGGMRSSDNSGIQFPQGVVKRTWADGYARHDDIKIEEVLQKDDLELAILSSFQVEPDWVLSKIDETKTKIIWVLQAKTEDEKQNWISGAPKYFRFCFPSMKGNVNCMHSKLQILAHPTHLRLVIPSANLVPYDWGENGGIMENICFIIDLPRLQPAQAPTHNKLTAFGEELVYFMNAMGLDKSVINSVSKFDFSQTANIAFVHSIGGPHSGLDWQRTGYCGLGTAIKRLGLDTEGPIMVDAVAASIGNLKDSFIQSIYLAAQGDDGLKEYQWRTSKAAAKQLFQPTITKIWEDIQSNFRIYFPSRETVSLSKGGVGAGNTICFSSKWFDAPTFPRALMRDCKSNREGLLMHNKMLFVRPQRSRNKLEELPRQPTAWAYIGSANLSESAWGHLSKDKTTNGPKLICRNWECGVVVSIPQENSARTLGEMRSGATSATSIVPGMEIFNGHLPVIPVPMMTPGEAYGQRRPWFAGE